MRILVVEDDDVIGERLQHALRKDGHVVDWEQNGVDGFNRACVEPYGLIILDVMLPGMDGFAICEGLRRHKKTSPILMLTAKDAVPDRVKGLDSGADDYLVKPFDVQELRARVRALLRRDRSAKTSVLHVADVEIDTVGQVVKRGSETMHLTPREYQLLEALVRNRGRVLTREVIIEQIWGDDRSLSNTVNFHVTSLRKKIDGGREHSLIETVHGFGYRITEDS